jgi:hypothetical protein
MNVKFNPADGAGRMNSSPVAISKRTIDPDCEANSVVGDPAPFPEMTGGFATAIYLVVPFALYVRMSLLFVSATYSSAESNDFNVYLERSRRQKYFEGMMSLSKDPPPE